MDKKNEHTPMDQSADFQLVLKKEHTHARVNYKAGTKLAEFEPSPTAVAFMKKHKIV